MRGHAKVPGDPDKASVPASGSGRHGVHEASSGRRTELQDSARAIPANDRAARQDHTDLDAPQAYVQSHPRTSVSLDRPAHVVLLSDRGPIRFSEDLIPQRQSSSVTALLDKTAQAASFPVTWITPSTAEADAQARRLGLFRGLSKDLGYEPDVVLVSRQDYRRYYDDVGVNIIWSAWHGVEDDIPVRCSGRGASAAVSSYAAVNDRLSARAADVAAPGAVVAVQDYQLMLCPALLRRRRPDLRIVHFLHTPFPSTASLDRLPPALVRTLLTGILGANLIGFQSDRWAHRFMVSCRRLGLGVDLAHGLVHYEDRRVWVRRYSVPVDGAALRKRADSAAVRHWRRQTLADDQRRRIVRVDRLDPAKNALRGFEAFAQVLRSNPHLADRVRFEACLIPSRERLSSYRHYASRTWDVIEDVNRRHPGAITVHYGDDQDRALGVMCGYDVLLVNSVADGMNLVAKEGPVVNTVDGAVVLSSQAGAADELTGALVLNEPRDVRATATALETALTMPGPERRQRAQAMQRAVNAVDPSHWLNRQLSDVLMASSGAAPESPAPDVPGVPPW
jgi:trehalose 6-phosphate synthase